MKHPLFSLTVVALMVSTSACAQDSPEIHLINQAISAAPDHLKEGAKVLGYNEDGTFRVVREGTNEIVCTTDDLARDGWEAACFHVELEAYITRGRQLRAEGMSGRDTVTKRGEEIVAGTLSFTSGPATQYIRFGDDASYDEASGEVMDSRLRYVIYIPDATTQSSGLPDSPIGPGAPWLMSAGTWRAHIMITPPAGGGE